MKYKLVYSSVALVAFLSFIIGCTQKDTQEQVSIAPKKSYTLKLATTWGPTLEPFVSSAKNLAKNVEEMSNGQLKIRIDYSNKHKSPLGVFDMVRSGQYDMAHSASYYWKGKDINLLPFTTMPFGMTTPEQYAWFYHGGGMELMQEAYSKHNMYSYPGGNTGNQMGGWFKKEINSLSDLEGLKMRIPGFAGDIFKKVGAVPTNIPSGELYTSLERGVIDALEWVGPGMDINMGFHKIAPYYYTGWHEPATELQFLVSKESMNKLPTNLQTILITAMKLAAYNMYIENYHLSGVKWKEIKEDYPKIKIKTLPAEVMNAMRKANKELKVSMAADNPFLAKVFKSQDDYMKKAREWTIISDYKYLQSNLD